MMKVLYLYTELQGHNIPIFERLATNYAATVEVFHWTQNKLCLLYTSPSPRD